MGKKQRYIAACIAIIAVVSIALMSIINSVNNVDATNVEEAENYSGQLYIVVNKEDQLLRKHTEEFNEKYKKLKINIEILDQYETQIKDYINQGKQADIMLIPNYIDNSELQNNFVQLGDFNVLNEKYNFADNKCFNGKVYGITPDANANGLVYNKRVFYEAGIKSLPKNIEEFKEDLALIKKNVKVTPLYTNYNDDWALKEWEDFCFGAMTGDSSYKNNKFYNEPNQFKNGTSHYEVYKLLYDLVKEGLCEDNPEDCDWETSKKLMNDGKIGCMVLDSWAVNQIKNAGPNGDDIGYMAFPTNKNNVQSVTITPNYCYGININSTNKEAAKAWMDFIMSESEYALESDNISTLKNDGFPEALINLKDCQLLIDDPATKDNEQRKAEFKNVLEEITNGKEQRKIIDAARRNESFDEIMNSWNRQWESARTLPAEAVSTDKIQTKFENKSDTERHLSEEDKEFIQSYNESNGKLKVGYIDEDYPVQYKDKKTGEFAGISADVLKKISQDTGLNFVYIPCKTETEAIRKLQNKEIDLIAGVQKRDETNTWSEISLSKDYLNITSVRVKNKETSGKADGDKVKIALKKGNLDYINNENQENNLYFDTFEECIKAVDKGKADYTYGNMYSASYYQRVGDYNNIALDPTNVKLSLAIGFNNENLDNKIISIINKSIYNISSDDVQKMIYENAEKYETKTSISKFIKDNLLMCIIGFAILNGVVIVVIIYILHEKAVYSRNMEIANRQYEILSDLSDEYTFEYDYDKNILTFSNKFHKYFGWPKTLDLNYWEKTNKPVDEFIEKFQEALDGSENINNTKALYKIADGSQQWFKELYSIMKDKHNIPIKLVGKLVNVNNEMVMKNKAFHDKLTGIYNRSGFENAFYKYIENHKEKEVALFVFDMDKFKEVNDTYGHQTGDKLLIALADNIKETFIEESCLIGRWGGDEFLACITENVNDYEIRKKAEEMCRKMKIKVSDGNPEKGEIDVSVSIGICRAKCTNSGEDIFKQADKALYTVKNQGRGFYWIKEIKEKEMSRLT